MYVLDMQIAVGHGSMGRCYFVSVWKWVGMRVWYKVLGHKQQCMEEEPQQNYYIPLQSMRASFTEHPLEAEGYRRQRHDHEIDDNWP